MLIMTQVRICQAQGVCLSAADHSAQAVFNNAAMMRALQSLL